MAYAQLHHSYYDNDEKEEHPISLRPFSAYGEEFSPHDNSQFKFPSKSSEDGSSSKNWKLIGYFTISKQPTSGQSVYKLYEHFDDQQYQYNYSAILEGDVRVMLPSRDMKIRGVSVILPNGSVPGKQGPHEVTLY